MGNEAVEETYVIIGDEGFSRSDIVERKKKSIVWIFAVHKEDKSKAMFNESVTRWEQSEEL